MLETDVVSPNFFPERDCLDYAKDFDFAANVC